jgi:hypothetical protein
MSALLATTRPEYQGSCATWNGRQITRHKDDEPALLQQLLLQLNITWMEPVAIATRVYS